MPQRYLLSAPTLEAAREKAAELYGPKARLVKAERVYDTGLRGLLGHQHVEAEVEAPDAPAPTMQEPAYGVRDRLGLAALLEDADAAEDRFAALGDRSVSTGSPRFDDVLAALSAETTAHCDEG